MVRRRAATAENARRIFVCAWAVLLRPAAAACLLIYCVALQNSAYATPNYILQAKEGDAEAQFTYGRVLEAGCKNPKYRCPQAVEWYRKAAEQGHVKAQYRLGKLYATGGYGVSADAPTAAEWYRKAAEQGHAKAQLALGWMYKTGRGVPEDEHKAMALFYKAAEQDEEIKNALADLQQDMRTIWLKVVAYFAMCAVVLVVAQEAVAWLLRRAARLPRPQCMDFQSLHKERSPAPHGYSLRLHLVQLVDWLPRPRMKLSEILLSCAALCMSVVAFALLVSGFERVLGPVVHSAFDTIRLVGAVLSLLCVALVYWVFICRHGAVLKSLGYFQRNSGVPKDEP
jgi:hypothetical protein